MARFEDLLGDIIVKVDIINNEEDIHFLMLSGKKYHMRHDQDCCESVYLEDTIGDWDDVMDAGITMAEEVCEDMPEAGERGTWTFYKLGTRKGSLTLRWNGQSNGYYSESVDFDEVG